MYFNEPDIEFSFPGPIQETGVKLLKFIHVRLGDEKHA